MIEVVELQLTIDEAAVILTAFGFFGHHRDALVNEAPPDAMKVLEYAEANIDRSVLVKKLKHMSDVVEQRYRERGWPEVTE